VNAAARHRESASTPWAWARQRRFPAEFRIAPQDPGQQAVAAPAACPAAATAPGPAPTPAEQEVSEPAGAGATGTAPGVSPEPADLPDRVVADLATEIWRARRKVHGPDAETDAPRAVRWASRYLSAAADRLTGAGIETLGHDGLRFDVGMELRVLAYQEAPDVTEETVIETIRPSVRRAGRVIQEGEVIVAVPERAAPEEAALEKAAPEQRGLDDA
jgi:hypothetical protein